MCCLYLVPCVGCEVNDLSEGGVSLCVCSVIQLGYSRFSIWVGVRVSVTCWGYGLGLGLVQWKLLSRITSQEGVYLNARVQHNKCQSILSLCPR